MIAKVNVNTCISCELCVKTCPGVFRMESEKAIAYLEAIPIELHILVQQATEECPVNAIEISEQEE
jgi:ferredoxin